MLLCVQEWASVLASPAVLRPYEACSTYEDAVMLAVSEHKSVAVIDGIVGQCLSALDNYTQGIVQVGCAGVVPH